MNARLLDTGLECPKDGHMNRNQDSYKLESHNRSRLRVFNFVIWIIGVPHSLLFSKQRCILVQSVCCWNVSQKPCMTMPLRRPPMNMHPCVIALCSSGSCTCTRCGLVNDHDGLPLSFLVRFILAAWLICLFSLHHRSLVIFYPLTHGQFGVRKMKSNSSDKECPQ